MTHQTKVTEELTVLEDHQNYWLVKDTHIPIEPQKNIVLKTSGLQHIAHYYNEKYGITIYVHETHIKIMGLADHIQAAILILKRENPALTQAGLIFISNDDPDDIFGHALPMIWQKDEEQEHLFFLDTMQLLGETDETKMIFNVDYFREQLLPTFKLWAMYGHRQVDYSSCYTDALVVLKDGLRQSSFKALVANKIKLQQKEITLFYAPEILLRTAQVVSLIGKSNVDHNTLVHKQHTLETWIKRYSTDIIVKNAPKKFGVFTLFKAEKYARKIDFCEKSESRQCLHNASPSVSFL